MDPYVGEIRAVGFNFAPRGWALCAGQLLAIAQNTALYSLLGTNFGGDGRTTFGLPNLQGRVAVGAGQGAGLSQYVLGQATGSQTVTLLTSQLAAHTHTLPMNTLSTTPTQVPGPSVVLGGGAPPRKAALSYYVPGNSATVYMLQSAVGPAGQSQPHNNMSPYLVMNYVIALQGIFPQRP